MKSLYGRRVRPTFTVALAVAMFIVELLLLLVRCLLSEEEVSTMLSMLVWCKKFCVSRRSTAVVLVLAQAPTENLPVKKAAVNHKRSTRVDLLSICGCVFMAGVLLEVRRRGRRRQPWPWSCVVSMLHACCVGGR